MNTPGFRAKVLEAEVNAAKEYLSCLSPEDLQKASACEGWTVADVLAHLASQPFVSRVNRGVQGDISPDPGAPAFADHDEDQFARNIFDRAKSAAEEHGERLLAALPKRHRKKKPIEQKLYRLFIKCLK